ncbi:MAG: hypothetical protein U0230_24920 [Polyangiales bacterium]
MTTTTVPCPVTTTCTNPSVGPIRLARCGQIASDDGSLFVVPALFTGGAFAVDVYDTCLGTGANPSFASSLTTRVIDPGGAVITGSLFADNTFELYVNGTYVAHDSVAYTPFDSSAVRFQARYPITYAVSLVDWEETLGVGLESNGGRNHIGDGGFVAVFSDGNVTDATWKCRAFYVAPLDDASCLREDAHGNLDSSACPSTDATVACVSDPTGESCVAAHDVLPADWMSPDFDDSAWPSATVYAAADVTNQPAYVDYASTLFAGGSFVWSKNLDLDNHVVCRVTVSGPR